MEATPEVPEVDGEGRVARRMARISRQRRIVAGLLAVVGAAALVAALTFRPDTDPADSSRPGDSGQADAAGTDSGQNGKPASTRPGGVGENPEKTGLPAEPAGAPKEGQVRTGTADEGCFDNVREYLEQWHQTGVEPDPCFTAQPASGQEQPDDVKRSYNGERF